MHPLTLLSWTLDRLEEGPVVLAVVVAVEGSVPRRPGAMQAIAKSGSHRGTVGGGTLESRVLDAAREQLARASSNADASPVRVEIDLRGSQTERRDGICGGRVSIELIRVDSADDDHARAIASVIERLARGDGCRLARDSRARLLAFDEDALGEGARATVFRAEADGWSIILRPRPLLLVIGGGHCGEALAAAAGPLEFDVVVEDDRAEIRRQVADATGVRVSPGPTSQTLLACGAERRETHVALVTRSFDQDVAALRALRALARPAASIGVMGSRRRLGTVFSLLREDGWTPAEIERLDAPIGEPLGAETPAEIAISILAGLVRRRAT